MQVLFFTKRTKPGKTNSHVPASFSFSSFLHPAKWIQVRAIIWSRLYQFLSRTRAQLQRSGGFRPGSGRVRFSSVIVPLFGSQSLIFCSVRRYVTPCSMCRWWILRSPCNSLHGAFKGTMGPPPTGPLGSCIGCTYSMLTPAYYIFNTFVIYFMWFQL